MILTSPLLLPSQSFIFTSLMYFTLIYNMYLLLYRYFYFTCTLTCLFFLYFIGLYVQSIELVWILDFK